MAAVWCPRSDTLIDVEHLKTAIVATPAATWSRSQHLLFGPQGMFIKRHKIEKDEGGGAFRPGDFAIGAAVRMYSRVMIVVDADPFTRRHMAALGLELGDPLPYPADPTEEYRSAFGRKVAGLDT